MKELKTLDQKVVTIFLSSIILFTVSWYFSNPKFFNEIFTFHKQFDPLLEDFASYTYWFILDFFLFLVIPFLIIKFLFKEKIKNYGLVIGNKNIGFSLTALSILVFLPIIYFISTSENFSSYFPLMQKAKDDLIIFIIYELLLLLFLFSWEFIFRGFILFGLEKRFGLYAIFIQMIPFVILHNGKPFLETFASIFGGLFLGYLALRTRSILYGFLIHAFILLTLDMIAFLQFFAH
ncbi:MAG: CPBP family intramembrane metalloprotease [Ignavibacteriae bacterium]|nr:CPBP family intramembrane metalloprotease [Ignavibacteriota bacterium]